MVSQLPRSLLQDDADIILIYSDITINSVSPSGCLRKTPQAHWFVLSKIPNLSKIDFWIHTRYPLASLGFSPPAAPHLFTLAPGASKRRSLQRLPFARDLSWLRIAGRWEDAIEELHGLRRESWTWDGEWLEFATWIKRRYWRCLETDIVSRLSGWDAFYTGKMLCLGLFWGVSAFIQRFLRCLGYLYAIPLWVAASHSQERSIDIQCI